MDGSIGGSTRLVAALAAAVTAVGTASATTPAPPAPARGAGGAPPALHGAFPGGSGRLAVRVFAVPDGAAASSARAGRRVRLFQLPASAVDVSGSRYSVAVSPGLLPPTVTSPRRVVTFQVVARDLGTGRYGSASVSARYVAGPPRDVRAGDAGGWVDPTAAVWSPTTARFAARPAGVRLDVPLVAARPGPSVAPSAARSTGAATIVWGVSRNVWATIGSGYPTSGQTSWMRFVSTRSVAFTTTLGVAMAYNGVGFNYSERGTRSLDRAFGFGWDRSGAQRLYQVGVTYRHAVLDLGPNPTNLRFISEWVPVGYNGGTHDVRGVRRPDWGRCVRQSRGDWFRNLSSGRSYENSAGVQLAFARVSLSSRRGYNSEAQLGYHNLRGQRLCGNNADPAHAGAIMQRKR